MNRTSILKLQKLHSIHLFQETTLAVSIDGQIVDKTFKWKPGYWFEKNFGTTIEPNDRICHKNGHTVQMVLNLRDTCKSYTDTDPKRSLAL